jgi:hypothetical protein
VVLPLTRILSLLRLIYSSTELYCKIASNEEPLDIFRDYHCADKPTNVESPISDALGTPNVLEPFAGSGQPF